MANDRVIKTAHNQRVELKRLNEENAMLRKKVEAKTTCQLNHECISLREMVAVRDRKIEELRKMLRSACIEWCHDCGSCSCTDGVYTCGVNHGECFVQEWRVAIGMNGGKQ